MRSGSEILLESTNWEHENDFLDLKNLKNLVRHGEGQRLEFKMKVKFPEKIIKELVAFANTDGGHLFLGVSDEGQIEGLKFAEEEQYLLERAIEKYCFPAFSYTAYPISLENGRTVLVYQVFESVDKPHFVQLSTDSHPQCFVRIKDRTVQASKEMKQILRRENQEGIQFSYGDSERWLMEYLRNTPTITLEEFATLNKLPLWIASRKLVLLVLTQVLTIIPGESLDHYTLK
jgi:predicted HTH transcriptional regulator